MIRVAAKQHGNKIISNKIKTETQKKKELQNKNK